MSKYLTKEEVRKEYQDFCDKFNKENNLTRFNGIFVQEGGYFDKNDGILTINYKNLNHDKLNAFLDEFFKKHPEHETNISEELIIDTSNKYVRYIKD